MYTVLFKYCVFCPQNFLKGLGATQDKAMNIFEGLVNSSSLASTDNIADITGSLNVLNLMSSASSYFPLHESVLPVSHC